MKLTKKSFIVLLSSALFFSCDNGAKEELKKCKMELEQLTEKFEISKLQAEKQAAKAMKFETKYKESNARSVKSQLVAEKLAGKLAACKKGK